MSYKVLIVDDSAILRQSIKRAVAQAGVADADVFEAGNGREALDALQQQPVDLVLLDLNMPVMGGHEFVEQCASRPELAGQTIVVVTAESNKQRLAAIKSLGVAGMLRKPFEPEALSGLVADMRRGQA